MSGFDSSIGSKKFGQNQIREFIVPDMDDEMPQMSEQEIWMQRKIKAEGKEQISAGAKRRIEILCNMSRSSKEIKIDGISFGLTTLKTKEVRDALIEVAKFDGTIEGTFEIRRQFLARSLVSVEGQDLEMFLGDNSIKARLNFVDELDDTVADKLYKEYVNFNAEHSEKYFPKTEKEVKEVSEDLKK